MLEADSVNPHSSASDSIPFPELVMEELHRIMASQFFMASRRGKDFLEYVVSQELQGNRELLKERLIGIHLFRRKPDYSTGDDPVVRVQAGEVRKRLERYYSEAGDGARILIQIPVGSYTPVFQVRNPPSGDARDTASSIRIEDPVLPAEVESPGIRKGASEQIRNKRSDEHPSDQIQHETDEHSSYIGHSPDTTLTFLASETKKLKTYSRYISLLCLVLVAYIAISAIRHRTNSIFKEFWQPAHSASKAVLLCLPKPMLYKPSDRLFERYARSHPNAPDTRETRHDKFLPLAPSEPIQWGDMVPSYNSGPGIGGVTAALNMSKLLTEQGLSFEVRFGDDATFVEMRGAPVVIIGSMNTDWASQLAPASHFAFDQAIGAARIYETVGSSARVWSTVAVGGRTTLDFGLVTRQISGKTGQFLLQVAGITHYGTEAASEFLLDQKKLGSLLRAESVDLHKNNLQIVVSTEITNGRAGPPHIEAVTSW